MTDKQMEEKKKEFMDKFFKDVVWHKEGKEVLGWKTEEIGIYVMVEKDAKNIWQWIEKLVEEVERRPEEEHRHNWVMTSHESFPFPQFTCPDCGMRKETSKYSRNN